MATKSFKGFVPEQAVNFELESADGVRKVTVACTPSVPGSKFLEFMGSIGPGGMEDFAALARTVREVLNVSIAEEDRPLFWEFVGDPANGIGLEQLSEIAGWLAEQFAGERPTARSPVSRAG